MLESSKLAIIKQLKSQKPRFVVKTFFRLRQEGLEEEEAINIIEQVYLDISKETLKNKNGFNNEYEKALEKYTRQNDMLSKVKIMSIEQLFAAVGDYEGYFPKYELCELISRKDELIPYLLEFIKVVGRYPGKFVEEDRYFAFIYSYYILALYKDKRAFPYLVSILHEEDEIIENLFGDTLTERMPAIIAGVYDGNLDAIKEIIENKSLYCFTRTAAIRALTILVLYGEIQRELVIGYFRNFLKKAKNEDSTVIGAIISECCDLHPKEAMEEIKLAFKKRIVSLQYIDLDFVKSFLNMSFEEVLEFTRNNWHCKMIDNLTSEFEDFFCFNDIDTILEELGYSEELIEEEDIFQGQSEDLFTDEMEEELNNYLNLHLKQQNSIVSKSKVGRNDPCPCGSGKKYKKCCGK